MARTVRGGSLETRTARLRLEPRGKPYWAPSGKPGLHLGYRRLAARNGSWIARRYQGRPGEYEVKAFAQADDYADADSDEVLSYFEAMRRVAGAAPPVRHAAGRYSVQDVIDDYLTWLRRHRKSAAGTKSKLASYVTPYFADRAVSTLKHQDFEQWLEWALHHTPSRRTKTGKTAKPSKLRSGPPAEAARRKRSTLNRVIGALKAALNRAFEEGRIQTDAAWSRLQKFRSADSARIQRLTADQARRLMNASAPDFRRLVEAALVSGCRYGELCALAAHDYDSGSATLLVSESKGGKPRRIPLTVEGVSLFDQLTAGKLEADALLTRSDGTPWKPSHQARRMAEACAAAKISPVISFHALRHTFASLLVEAGTPLAFVADALGHADTRMVSRHYAHLAPSVVHDSIRANLPTFGIRVDATVRKVRS